MRALHKASLQIKDGEYVVLLGPSGCGKTTLLKSIAGIIEPTSGRISIGKSDVTERAPEDRHIGFVFQNYALFPHLSALDNCRYGLLARGEHSEKSKRLASEMLKMVHLENRHEAIPRELSGGMQQRLAVSRALSTGSKLLLLDEPTNALDAYLRFELRNELRKMAKKLHLTAIHVTHDQEEAMAIADKIVVMRKGEILQVGSPEQVYDYPATLFVANFLGGANFIQINLVKGHGRLLGQDVKFGNETGEFIAAIRPEHLHFSDAGAKVGFISSCRLGHSSLYEVD
ncbi:ABC transporter ATP-binding protein, partial [Candidatus Parvarchaeota archaeon]|nr:ABC transporter ATP-binding protein [Candidatus Parvarchaeota archaeon]